MCTGQEAVLHQGIYVVCYYYGDVDLQAQRVATNCILQLYLRYPDLFPISASDTSFGLLPQDVTQVTPAHLRAVGANDRSQWLIIAGWECQNLSLVGNGSGLRGPESSTFYDLLHLLHTVQEMQPARTPGLILENVVSQCHPNPDVHERNHCIICSALGKPALIDAAQCGSAAHHLRNIWTNLCNTAHLQRDAEARDPTIHAGYAQRLLDEGRFVQMAQCNHPRLCTQVNIPGLPLRVLPTSVAYPTGHNFCPGTPGLINTTQGV